MFLVGFMAAGKSTVAAALGARIDWRVEDIDTRIEARERSTVADIFAARGETWFRATERAVLRELLPLRHTVVATGGGTFADPGNRRLINADGASVWLTCRSGPSSTASRPTGGARWPPTGPAWRRCTARGARPTGTRTCGWTPTARRPASWSSAFWNGSASE